VVEQALVVIGVASIVGLIAAVVLTVVVVRGVRRRVRSVRQRLRVLGWSTAPRSRPQRPPTSVAAATVGSPGWWLVQNRRHRMWRAVSSAEHAVDIARRSEVAVGDLPHLADRLRAAALGVDSVLRASARRGSLRAEDRADCDRIEEAAADIHGAAVSSLSSVAHGDTEPLLSAVQIEVAALASGVRAAFR